MAGEFLIGAADIARFLSELTGRPFSTAKLYHAVDRGAIPVGRMGGKLIASRADLRAHLGALSRPRTRRALLDDE